MTDPWFDDAAGPVVRPYAMTRGRTRADTRLRLDLIALVIADDDALQRAEDTAGPGYAADSAHRTEADPQGGTAPGVGPAREDSARSPGLAPEHLAIVRRCSAQPRSVAELATDLDLPVGVVRVLISDLVTAGLVRVTRPVPPAELPDETTLREVIDGLRAL
ncbi:DUF742 domain-containing protein [Streptomyces sp. JJ66]|uniref:DUF742 domain-containing protein n=1 Tax=Streptomyces sp. JJ66 TaxID=2803843 RepID=UPI001C5618D7|nr:DUF742 domain-containing protein [Streptomyces sp. JJ66]MBW1602127.1 DUF742 domain-containing protein [Streptomyces sp. JJ66]